MSCDQYKLPDGSLINLDQMTLPPKGATLWRGYNYDLQEWWFEGKRDERTLEELLAARSKENALSAT